MRLYIRLHWSMEKIQLRQISEEYYLVTFDNGDWKIMHADRVLEEYSVN